MSENKLIDFSDEDLLAEIKRRGKTINTRYQRLVDDLLVEVKRYEFMGPREVFPIKLPR